MPHPKPDADQSDRLYDVAIIGGGVNGCGVARDAAGRGYSVFLAEMGDLASGTSSASTKLIHGGLRYLEHYEFRLVREALAEREVLLGMAPHIAWPLRFVLPHHAGMRPAWLLRMGLFLYDHLGGRGSLPGTRSMDLRKEAIGAALQPRFARAFEYSDCWVDDARLVVLNARDAADRGADINTRTKVISARREASLWALEVEDLRRGVRSHIRARSLINAAGPWADVVLAGVLGRSGPAKTRLVKGSHVVVRRIGTHEQAFIFQNADGRIIFAIPYEHDFTLIGTTDEDYRGDPGAVRISGDEIDYLCRSASEYFAQAITRADVVWSYSGVRSLADDGASQAQEATRDYVLDVDGGGEDGVLVNIFGGKITTYRRLAEAVLVRVEAAIGRRIKGAWTRGAALPGGDLAVDGLPAEVVRLRRTFPFLTATAAHRLIRCYGTVAFKILEGAASEADLGLSFGGGLTEREVRHLVANEWARTVEDILWRRTKLGLQFGEQEKQALASWLDGHLQAAAMRSPSAN